MADFTKKQLNRIKAAAFEEFKSQYAKEEFECMFAGKNIVTAWRITEETESRLLITQYDAQVNMNTLRELGFTESAKIERLFFADRQTRTLSMRQGELKTKTADTPAQTADDTSKKRKAAPL